ncbi:MAG: excinuclease ABC subunit UvrC [Dehalococcoidales bacterium]|nr:excinuclease ABC subunit UvrC [Dehalococcoidales bacterium]
MTGNLVNEQLKQLPANPGVYLMKDAAGKIIYVGKASDLSNRVRSYFQASSKLTPKTRQLVAEVNELEFFITNSEYEALILENNLIKRYRPYYNVRLKDDKTFPYIRINLNEDWPAVSFTRYLKNDGARYFGPFTNAWSVRQTLKVLESIFRFRSCNKAITGADKRACLKYHLGHCMAPCIGAVNQQEYKEAMRQIILFLEGRQEKVARELEQQMKVAAEAMDFERAARLRDQIEAIKSVVAGQKIAAKVSGEEDVIAFATDRDLAYVQVFFIRDSKLIGRESFVLTGANAEEPEQIMTSFVKQYYDSATYIPPRLLLQHPIEDKDIIREWLRQKRGGAVDISVPGKGNKKQLVQIVAENAGQGLKQMKLKQLAAPAALESALEELQEKLGLLQLPARLEGYDISNIQGKEAVGSMVVFENGRARPSHYRRFRIRTVPSANDYAMLQEVLRRRFKQVASEKMDTTATESWGILPDLVLIDGGKGQLNMARAAMEEVGAGAIPAASLAKENEEIFLPGRKTHIILPRNSPGLQLLQRVRDEAHRFAVAYFTKVHKKKTFTSSLDNIPGIGPKRKRALLKQFGTVKGIKNASAAELMDIKGMTPNLAERLKEHLE